MTYSLNATVNSGISGKLAYYSGNNSIDDYTSTVGGAHAPIYLNNGVPAVANSYYIVRSSTSFNVLGISGYFYIARYGQVVVVSIQLSNRGNGSTGTATLATNLPRSVVTTGQALSKGGGSALRYANFYVSSGSLYLYSYQADNLPQYVSITYITGAGF